MTLRLFKQLKCGCKKALCLNEHCASNLFGKFKIQLTLIARAKLATFKRDAEILAHAVRILKGG
jgi:hypothetical protein